MAIPRRAQGVLFDLLMGVMDSLEIWTAAGGDPERGLRWRDAATARMVAARAYSPYEGLVRNAATDVGLPAGAAAELFDGWSEMEPRQDAAALDRLSLPYGFVTNTSAALAEIAAHRSGLAPRFTMSAEEAGWYKPEPGIYQAACRKLGMAPGTTIFVAGSPYDAAGARAAGMDAWLVLRRQDHRSPSASISVATSLETVITTIEAGGPPLE